MSGTAQVTRAGSRTGFFARRWSQLHARLYRRTRGRFMPKWFGAPVVVLETVGRKSGKPRATPILYLRDGERLVVMASNAGHDSTPAWWLNLRAAGEGTAVLAGDRWKVRPRIPEGEERDRLWQEFKRMYPAAEDYLGFTQREIPLIVLEPA